MTRYVIGCCDSTVAGIEVSAEDVTIFPPDGEELYRLTVPPRIEDPSLDHEQMRIEYQARDKIHRLMMERVEVTNRHVSEVIWADHSSWIIRCLTCGQQFEVTPVNLPRLGRVLAAGDWSATGHVVPLGVLNRKAT